MTYVDPVTGPLLDRIEALQGQNNGLRLSLREAVDGHVNAVRRAEAAEAERDELRLVLLAEQGDRAGAPSEGWTVSRGVVWDHPTRGRVARATHGQEWVWTGYQPGQTPTARPTAREAMIRADEAADAAAKGGER